MILRDTKDGKEEDSVYTIKTWGRIETPRDLISLLISNNPLLEADELRSLFIKEVLRHVDTESNIFLETFFVNLAALAFDNARWTKTRVTLGVLTERREEREHEKEKIKNIITTKILTLDWQLNGKPLRECTFGECAKYGGWLVEVSKKGKPTQKVGDVLTDKDLHNICKRGE